MILLSCHNLLYIAMIVRCQISPSPSLESHFISLLLLDMAPADEDDGNHHTCYCPECKGLKGKVSRHTVRRHLQKAWEREHTQRMANPNVNFALFLSAQNIDLFSCFQPLDFEIQGSQDNASTTPSHASGAGLPQNSMFHNPSGNNPDSDSDEEERYLNMQRQAENAINQAAQQHANEHFRRLASGVDWQDDCDGRGNEDGHSTLG